MPFLFREIVFCECGRPAMVGTDECRTCYEDVLRRMWRDERRIDGIVGVPEPIRALNPLLRRLQAPEPEEDGELELDSPSLRNGVASRRVYPGGGRLQASPAGQTRPGEQHALQMSRRSKSAAVARGLVTGEPDHRRDKPGGSLSRENVPHENP
jgi:hypothetical protein